MEASEPLHVVHQRGSYEGDKPGRSGCDPVRWVEGFSKENFVQNGREWLVQTPRNLRSSRLSHLSFLDI